MPAKLTEGDEMALALTHLRRIAGRTRHQLAAACALSVRTIEAFEQGTRLPPPETVASILSALQISMPRLAAVVALIRQVRGEIHDQSNGRAIGLTDTGRGPELERRIATLLLPQPEPDDVADGPATIELSRQRATALWARFKGCTEEVQRELIREAAELQTSGFCELLCEESRLAVGASVAHARHLAELAVLAADRLRADERWRCRARGYAGAHLASVLRAGGSDLPQAARLFTGAEELWTAGADADPGLFNAARMLHLKASLRRAQRRLPEALGLLDQALAADRWDETPSLLISKAKAVEELGEYEQAIALLRQAALLIDADRDPSSSLFVQMNLAGNLCHLGRFEQAALLLPQVEALAGKLGNQLDLLRVAWQRGKIAAGQGRAEDAISILERLRSDFAELGNAYDAALVTLEVAAIHASLGHTAQVKQLVPKAAAIFEAQGVRREVRRALGLVRQQAARERLTGELLRKVIEYLCRARRDPHLRFAAPR
jgi:tetratricopeptide (TPR) repeat protein